MAEPFILLGEGSNVAISNIVTRLSSPHNLSMTIIDFHPQKPKNTDVVQSSESTIRHTDETLDDFDTDLEACLSAIKSFINSQSSTTIQQPKTKSTVATSKKPAKEPKLASSASKAIISSQFQQSPTDLATLQESEINTRRQTIIVLHFPASTKALATFRQSLMDISLNLSGIINFYHVPHVPPNFQSLASNSYTTELFPALPLVPTGGESTAKPKATGIAPSKDGGKGASTKAPAQPFSLSQQAQELLKKPVQDTSALGWSVLDSFTDYGDGKATLFDQLYAFIESRTEGPSGLDELTFVFQLFLLEIVDGVELDNEVQPAQHPMEINQSMVGLEKVGDKLSADSDTTKDGLTSILRFCPVLPALPRPSLTSKDRPTILYRAKNGDELVNEIVEGINKELDRRKEEDDIKKDILQELRKEIGQKAANPQPLQSDETEPSGATANESSDKTSIKPDRWGNASRPPFNGNSTWFGNSRQYMKGSEAGKEDQKRNTSIDTGKETDIERTEAEILHSLLTSLQNANHNTVRPTNSRHASRIKAKIQNTSKHSSPTRPKQPANAQPKTQQTFDLASHSSFGVGESRSPSMASLPGIGGKQKESWKTTVLRLANQKNRNSENTPIKSNDHTAESSPRSVQSQKSRGKHRATMSLGGTRYGHVQRQTVAQKKDQTRDEQLDAAASFLVEFPPKLLNSDETVLIPSFIRKTRMSLREAVSFGGSGKGLGKRKEERKEVVEVYMSMLNKMDGQATDLFQPATVLEAASFISAFAPSADSALTPLTLPLPLSPTADRPSINTSQSTINSIIASRRQFYSPTPNSIFSSPNDFGFGTVRHQVFGTTAENPLGVVGANELSVKMANCGIGNMEVFVFPSIAGMTQQIQQLQNFFSSSVQSSKLKKEEERGKRSATAIQALQTLPSQSFTSQNTPNQAPTLTPNLEPPSKSLSPLPQSRQTQKRKSISPARGPTLMTQETLIVHAPSFVFDNLISAFSFVTSPLAFHTFTGLVQQQKRQYSDAKMGRCAWMTNQFTTTSVVQQINMSNGVSFPLQAAVNANQLSSSIFLPILVIPNAESQNSSSLLSSNPPSPFIVHLSQSPSLTNFKALILNTAEAVRMATKDMKKVAAMSAVAFPNIPRPPDMLTLNDISGDFAEIRGFLKFATEEVLSGILKDNSLSFLPKNQNDGPIETALPSPHSETNEGMPGDEYSLGRRDNNMPEVASGPVEVGEKREAKEGVENSALFRVLLCAAFSEMLCSNTAQLDNMHVSPSRSTMSGRQFVPVKFFSSLMGLSPQSQSPVSPTWHTPEPGSATPMSFSNSSLNLSLPSPIEQVNKRVLGSFLFISHNSNSVGENSPVAGGDRRPPGMLQRRKTVSSLRSASDSLASTEALASNLNNINFVGFPHGVGWDGELMEAQVEAASPSKLRRKSMFSLMTNNDNTKTTLFSSLSQQSPTSPQTNDSFPQLRAVYAPPVVDPSEYRVTEHHSPEVLGRILSHLMLFDLPVRTMYFPADDSLLVAIGSVGEKEGQSGIDRVYWARSALDHERVQKMKRRWEANSQAIRRNSMESRISSVPSTPVMTPSTKQRNSQAAHNRTKSTLSMAPLLDGTPTPDRSFSPTGNGTDTPQQKPALIARATIHPKFTLPTFRRPTPIVEQFSSFASPRAQVTLKSTLQRVGKNVEASVIAIHRRGHVFSLRKRGVLAVLSQLPPIELSAETQEILLDEMKEKFGEEKTDTSDLESILRSAIFNRTPLTPSLTAFVECLSEIADTVPMSFVNSSYSAAVNQLLETEKLISERPVEEVKEDVKGKDKGKAKDKQPEKLGVSEKKEKLAKFCENLPTLPPLAARTDSPTSSPSIPSSPSTKMKSRQPSSALLQASTSQHASTTDLHASTPQSSIIPFPLLPNPLTDPTLIKSSFQFSPLIHSLVRMLSSPALSKQPLSTFAKAFTKTFESLTSLQLSSFDYSTINISNKSLIDLSLLPTENEDFMRSAFVANQFSQSSLNKLTPSADVAYHLRRIMKNPLQALFSTVLRRNLINNDTVNALQGGGKEKEEEKKGGKLERNGSMSDPSSFSRLPSTSQPVQIKFTTPPHFTSSFNDRTTASMRIHGVVSNKKTPTCSGGLEVSYSTNDGVTVAVCCTTGRVKLNHHAVPCQEGEKSTLDDRKVILSSELRKKREDTVRIVVDAARRFAAKKAETDLERFRKNETVCGMKRKEEIPETIPKGKPAVKEPTKKGAAEKDPQPANEPSPSTWSSEEKECFRRCFTLHFSQIIRKTESALLSLPPEVTEQLSVDSVEGEEGQTNQISRTVHGAAPAPVRTASSSFVLSRNPSINIPSELRPFISSPLPTLFPHTPFFETERIIVGMGSCIVKSSSGTVGIMMPNGDVSVCNGDEWMTLNESGESTARPLFSVPIVPEDAVSEEDRMVKECFDGIVFPAEIVVDSSEEMVGEDEEAPQPLHSDDSNEPSSTQRTKLTKTIQTLPSRFPCPASSLIAPSSESCSLTPNTILSLPKAQTVTVSNSEAKGTILTRADGVMVIQHNTGERIVHHSDGTRISHTFAFADDEALLTEYEAKSGWVVPMKAIVCVEHQNSPRVVVHLVNKSIGQLFRSEAAVKATSNWVREKVVVHMADGAVLEWIEATQKVVLSKPDNTHLHFTNTGNVSVFVEHPSRPIPSAMGPTFRLPLLHFNSNDGAVTVRPSKRAQPISAPASQPSSVANVVQTATELPTIVPPSFPSKTDPHSEPSPSSIPPPPSITTTSPPSLVPTPPPTMSKKPLTARRIFFMSVDGTSQWLISRNMRTAAPVGRVAGAFNPVQFGQTKMGGEGKTQKNEKEALVESILSTSGMEDRDSLEFMEKRLKEMKQMKEHREEKELEALRKLKRVAQIQKNKEQSGIAGITIEPSQLPGQQTTPNNDASTLSPQPYQVSARDDDSPLPLSLADQRWVARLSALHDHQVQLASDLYQATVRPNDPPSIPSSIRAFVLPRLFVVRQDGSGFEMMRTKAVTKLYPLNRRNTTNQHTLYSSADVVTHPFLSLPSTADTNTPVLPSISSSPDIENVKPDKPDSVHLLRLISENGPLVAFCPLYSQATDVCYDVVAKVSTVDIQRMDEPRREGREDVSPSHLLPSSAYQISTPQSDVSQFPRDVELGEQSKIDNGVLACSFPLHSTLHPITASQTRPSPASISSLSHSDVESLVSLTSRPLPALFGHGEDGLPLALQQFSSPTIPPSLGLTVAKHDFVEMVNQSQTVEPNTRGGSEASRHAPFNKNEPLATLTPFASRVSFFGTSDIIPVGSVVSPARVASVLTHTPDVARQMIVNMYASSSRKEHIGGQGKDGKGEEESERRLDEKDAMLRAFMSSQGRQHSNAFSITPTPTQPPPLTICVPLSAEQVQSATRDTRSNSEFADFTTPQQSRSPTPTNAKRDLSILSTARPAPSSEPPSSLISSSSSILHLSVVPCTNAHLDWTLPATYPSKPPQSNPLSPIKPPQIPKSTTSSPKPEKTVPDITPTKIPSTAVSDSRPVWSPYLPELLKYEPSSVRDKFLPAYLKDMHLPQSILAKIVNGEIPIPHPDLVVMEDKTETGSVQFGPKPTQTVAYYSELVEHPPPPPMLLLTLFEFGMLSSYVYSIRNEKALSRLGTLLSAYIDKMWSGFSSALDEVSETILHVRMREGLKQQVLNVLGGMFGQERMYEEELPEKKDNQTSKKGGEKTATATAKGKTASTASIPTAAAQNEQKPLPRRATYFAGPQTLSLDAAQSQLPSLQVNAVRNDPLYGPALNVIFEMNSTLNLLVSGISAQEWTIKELLSSQWRRGGFIPFEEPFCGSEGFGKMERRSFGMCGDSDVKPLFPVTSSASTLPLSLPDLYSAVTSHLASLPSENQKSKKNVGTAKKENLLPLVAAQRKEREMVLKELFVNDASHIVSIYNSVSMESALSEAGKATKNDADGYGMFEDRIQKVVKQMKTQADHSKIRVSQSPGRTQDNPTQLMKSGESRRSQKSLLQRQQTNVMKKPAGIQAAEVNEILTTLSVMEGGGEKKGSAGSVGSPTHSEEETERDYLRPGQGHLGYWGSREEEGLRYSEQKEERTDSRSVVKRARLEMTSSQFVPTDITAELEEAARRGKKEERVGEKRRAKTLSPPLNTLRHSVQSVSSTTATASTQNTANRRGSPLLRFSVDSKENWLAMSQLKATRSKSPVLVGEKTKESRRMERSVGMSVDSVATRKSGKSWMDRSSGLETTDASLALPHLPQSSNQTPLSGKTHSSRVAVELAMKTLQNDSTSQSHPKSAFVGVTGKTRTRPVIHTSTQSQRGVNGEEIAKAQPIPNPDFVLQEGMGTRVVKTSSIGGILQHATKLSGFEVWPAELDFGEMSGTTGAGLENGKCLERNDGNLYRTHFVIQNNGLDSERWMVSTFDGKRGCFRVTTAPSLVAPGMAVKVNVECNTAIVKRGVCEKEGVRTVRERVGDSEGESGDEAERSRKPVDSQKQSDPLPFSYSTSGELNKDNYRIDVWQILEVRTPKVNFKVKVKGTVYPNRLWDGVTDGAGVRMVGHIFE
ncbi:hypothetical protein BLNAU_4995 [Blattamonas nauphoetae]|uniref:Uncharacterized protein n=1 Tax=Blattamonas nauphoetae TaxID=2049346 RepID=A0ABQ9Y8Q0_9EUKA|nr:hypothetical protein BLNAU_4995 [Blattamonas nauphoetae]